MNKPTTVLIADDHPIFRAGLRQVIERDSSFRVVGEVDNGRDALLSIERERPVAAILDIRMPELTGLAVAEEVEKKRLETKIILLTMIKDDKIFLKAMDLGIIGYVLKDSAAGEIVKALHSVADGRYYISSDLSGLLAPKPKNILRDRVSSPIELLSAAERRIVTLIAQLKSNQEIADALFLSPRTVENHRVNISRKLQLHGRHALLKFSLEHRDELD